MFSPNSNVADLLMQLPHTAFSILTGGVKRSRANEDMIKICTYLLVIQGKERYKSLLTPKNIKVYLNFALTLITFG